MVLGGLELTSAEQLLVFLYVCFDRSEFVEQLVVLENLQIFDVEVGFVVALELFLWLAWIYSLQDAESAEVLQRDLHVPNRV